MRHTGEPSSGDESEWVQIEAVVATSRRVEKYGGFQLADSALAQIVDALNAGGLPMHGHHDLTKPIRTKDLSASLVALDDGETAVRIEGLVSRADWDAVGTPRGMSFSITEPLGLADGPNRHLPALTLSADAGYWDDEAIAQASSLMSRVAPTQGERLLQFSAIDELARIVLEIPPEVRLALAINLASSGIWDGIKFLMRRRRSGGGSGQEGPTRIEIHTPVDGGEVVAIVDTSDQEIARMALAKYSEAIAAIEDAGVEGSRRQTIEWHTSGESGGWEPPD